ncbi:hypothetical protein [Nodosilinea sp. E11]|uniref:hypothetical protein n=1 Tax=Nodosilinea sp. E11 TaxID=3037479 RepID=UPI002934F08A|nr:hypothetical protein [Nodosilinea sp. E11]WOD40766.1 hypothetical protein RRF56_08160 [Nodosilinea sp. E11]
MLFQFPPVLPVPSLTGPVITTATVRPNCERGSRDCFPKDLVGAVSEPHPALTADLMQLVLSDLFPVTV